MCIARKVPQIFLLDVVGLAKKKFAFPLRSIIFCSFVVTFFLLPCRISHQGCGHNTKLMRMQLSRALKVRFFYMYPRMHLCPSMVLKFLSGLISIYKEPLWMLWFLWESIRRRQLDVPLLQDSFCSEVYSCVFFFEPYWYLFVVPVGNDQEKLWFMNCIFLNMSWGKCYNYFYFVFSVGRWMKTWGLILLDIGWE
jgi:hypothetical protein